jgi:hypothetical protein
MPRINDIRAIEFLDSRGNPTVAASVTLEGGTISYAAALSVRPPAATKRWNFAIRTLTATAARASHAR